MNKYFSAFIAAFIFTAALFTLFNFSSCNETPVDPYDKLKPGRRDYTWTRDTLELSEDNIWMSLSRIWGTSPEDIWIGGDAGTYKDVLWHYNGKIWKRYILNKAVAVGGFYGINKNDIWMATRNKSFWHYNGDSWSEFLSFQYPQYGEVGFNDIDGLSNKEIYAVGIAGNTFDEKRTRVAMKYDGKSWEFINIPELDEVFVDVKIAKTTKNVFITADRNSTPSIPSYLYLLKNDSLIEILNSNKTISFGKINGQVYQIVGNKIYKYIDNELKLFKDLTQYNYAGRMWGRSEKDFFGLTWDYTISHYNGSDLQVVYQLSLDYHVAGALLFENDVFFLCSEFYSGTNFILHGKLDK